MQKQIENLIINAIDDFNSKWQSHEERNTGVSEYAEKIVNFISSNPVLADRLPNAEDVKRWFQLLVGKSEEVMQKDIEATFR